MVLASLLSTTPSILGLQMHLRLHLHLGPLSRNSSPSPEPQPAFRNNTTQVIPMLPSSAASMRCNLQLLPEDFISYSQLILRLHLASRDRPVEPQQSPIHFIWPVGIAQHSPSKDPFTSAVLFFVSWGFFFPLFFFFLFSSRQGFSA